MKINCSKSTGVGVLAGLFLGALLLHFGLQAQSGIPSVESKIDKNTITIGDVVTYSVTVTHNPDVKVDIPLAGNLGAFEIRDYQQFEPQKVDGQIVEHIDYLISTFDVGDFEIPPLEIRYTLPGDSTQSVLRTSKLNIVVQSLNPSQDGDVRDVKPPQELPRDYSAYILWGAIAFGIILLGLLGFYVWYRRRSGKSILPKKVEVPRPAHEIAFEKLRALDSSSLLEEGKIKEYYDQMSDIIRRYIEGRYFIVALEMTTFELMSRLRESEIEQEHIELIETFLSVCDLVKFAKYLPGKEEHRLTMDKAFDIVERTKLVYLDLEKDEASSGTEVEDQEAGEILEESLMSEK